MPPRLDRVLATVCTAGREHLVRRPNAAFCDLIGQSPEAVRNLPVVPMLAPSDGGADVRRLLDLVFDTGVPRVLSDVSVRPASARADEEQRYFTVLASPNADDSDGRGLLLQILDVTTYVLARRAKDHAAREVQLANEALLLAGLREQEMADTVRHELDRWNALLSSLTEGVAVLDGSGRPILVNPVGQRLLGMESHQPTCAYTECRLETLHGESLDPARHPARRALSGERFSDEELVCRYSNGSHRRLVFSGSAVQDGDGKVVLAINVYRDVTELRKLEETREDYIALVSHDLRNPLQALFGHAQLLLATEQGSSEKGDTSRAGKSARAILKVARRLAEMVDDLYQSAQLESGNLALHLESTSLFELVSDLCERLGTPEDQARIVLRPAPELPLVRVDIAKIERALVNLITNALKYSDSSSKVILELGRTADHVTIYVRDQGTGISAAELPFVFEKYRRADAGRQEGLGLGLYIARLMVEAHGGRTSVESERGRGSTFCISLPIYTRSSAAPEPSDPAAI